MLYILYVLCSLFTAACWLLAILKMQYNMSPAHFADWARAIGIQPESISTLPPPVQLVLLGFAGVILAFVIRVIGSRGK